MGFFIYKLTRKYIDGVEGYYLIGHILFKLRVNNKLNREKIMKLFNLYSVILFSLCTESAYAASFNCDNARTPTEHTICDHRTINDADVKMATTYNIIKRLVPMGTRGMIQDEQVKWLQLRDQCGNSTRCLIDVYKMRQQDRKSVV